MFFSYLKNMCNICLQEIYPNEKIIKLSCNHIFHKDCLCDWIESLNILNTNNLKFTCPNCRKKYILLNYIFENMKESSNLKVLLIIYIFFLLFICIEMSKIENLKFS